MSALTVDHGPDNGCGWDELVRAWEELDPPEGWKAEIIEGLITLSPAPANKHNVIAGKLQRSLYTAIPEDWGIYQTLAVSVPSRSGVFIPDLTVAPEAALVELSESEHYIPASASAFVAEITSKSSLRHDRVSKPAAYAHAGVPLYLLVDRWALGGPTITLYGEPKDDVYRVLQAGKFGDEIHLPEPFGIAIDTGVFPAM
ncbi:Uma2 family endonuclease [Streptomyces sp. ISL-11]|uniref:Uma2 family endonuclease n=1 Tax=Streptomyces sp. ISL-11 TaxID=2819174 RepID=UPI001BE62F6B|nr:Uma2 family endonuclease [Streptomyces sp. ISL-11]MBT2385734.1 Uma2 family endonuclease [Streptomyces sp. ISL-11]